MIRTVKEALRRSGAVVLLALAACGGGSDSGGADASPQALVETPRAESLTGGAMQGLGERLKPRRSNAIAPRAFVLEDASRERLKAQSARPDRTRPYKIGFAREVKALDSAPKAAASLDWTSLQDGRRVASISLRSPDAVAVRLGLGVDRLPPEATVRVYAQGAVLAFELRAPEILVALQRDTNASGINAPTPLYWLPVVEGPEATVELELPPAVDPASVQIALPRLSHFYRSPAAPAADTREQPKDVGDAEFCEINVSCDASYSNESNSVARMVFVEDGDSYQCTGSLLNDSSNSFTPYFLTAAHCISTQAVASSLQTYWFYRSPSCNARTVNPASRTLVGGAVLLRADVGSDVTLVRLNDPPPAGAYYAGWMAITPTLHTDVTALHHPAGDLQKISTGVIDSYQACTRDEAAGGWNCLDSGQLSSTYIAATFSRGSIEPGSSGSPLFWSLGSKRYIVGQASASSASCYYNDGYTTYGRFDVSYREGLKTWLGSSSIVNGNAASNGAGTGGRSAIYRFLNTVNGAYFFTMSAAERDDIIANFKPLRYEGPSLYAYGQPGADLSPVYRFYNTLTGVHFYTISLGERDDVIANLAYYRYEGIAWYARTTAGSSAMPLYRFYRTTNSSHFYTMDQAERDYVLNYPSVFHPEGIAYYAWAVP
jgi:hypothetical protein